jgi:cytochrome c
MNLIRNCLLALGLTVLLPAAHAQVNADAAKALAEKNLCLACHKVDEKLVGPSYRDVARKYQGDAEAQVRIIARLQNGGKGVWGTTPMPPVGKDVPEGDLKTIVAWILSLSSR